MHNDRFYRQIDGVTMGSPLGPTIANFCLAYFEAELFKDGFDTTSSPSLYLRYVDDIFCVFRIGSDYETFLTKLNNMHPSLQFTPEIGPSQLAFLDTKISLPTSDNENFSSSIYRKPTFTGLMLNYTAMCPRKWKIGLIKCLLHRAYTISSNWLTFSKEIDYLKDLFSKNGYPEDLFSSCLKWFLNSKYGQNSSKDKVEEDKVETIFYIPYIGLPSIIFSKKVRELFKLYYCIDVKVVFTSFKVRNYFSLKCHTPLPLLANVVYKFTCLRDANVTYIGKTVRHLATRVKEHATTNSAVKDHLQSCQTCHSNFSCNNFSIVDLGHNDFEVSIKEALHIKEKRPNLNKQLFSQGASFTLNIFS